RSCLISSPPTFPVAAATRIMGVLLMMPASDISAASDVSGCGHADDGEREREGSNSLPDNHAPLHPRILGGRAGKLPQGGAAHQSLTPGGREGAKSAGGQNLPLPAEARGMQQAPEVTAARDHNER